jgi:hypothetical protein
MDNTFVLGGSKKTHFPRPPDFSSSPPREVGLTQNPGGRLAEILTANHFHFFNNFSERPLLLTAICLPVFYPTAITIHSRFSSLKAAP